MITNFDFRVFLPTSTFVPLQTLMNDHERLYFLVW
jgi:hypothetical protein